MRPRRLHRAVLRAWAAPLVARLLIVLSAMWPRSSRCERRCANTRTRTHTHTHTHACYAARARVTQRHDSQRLAAVLRVSVGCFHAHACRRSHTMPAPHRTFAVPCSARRTTRAAGEEGAPTQVKLAGVSPTPHARSSAAPPRVLTACSVHCLSRCTRPLRHSLACHSACPSQLAASA